MYLFTTLDSPIGTLFLVEKNQCLTNVFLMEERFSEFKEKNGCHVGETSLLTEGKKQLTDYFLQKRKQFDIPVHVEGTVFQQKVWEALRNIPYGETRSYQEVAIEIGNVKAVRAIGQANRRNPLPIIIPCHRVIGKNKGLVGYAGKHIDKKASLLELEGVRLH